MDHEGDSASAYLVALARKLAVAYLQHTQPTAILLTGSAAEGTSDYYSDLDLILYYTALPSEAQIASARAANGGIDFRDLGPRTPTQCAEDYFVHNVECQVAHITCAAWEADMDRVLQDLDVESPIQKALGGLLAGLPLYGAAQIGQWQARAAAYPPALATAMIQHYLQFWPLWYLEERLAVRDATLWIHETLVESAYQILGVLAGLNRVYYSRFQFKRLGKFVAGLAVAPVDLAARIEQMLMASPPVAIRTLATLVTETTALVQTYMPDVMPVATRRPPGTRQQPWQPVSLPDSPRRYVIPAQPMSS